MKQNRVLFIGGNYSPEQIGIGKYNGEMVDWLANQGYDCTVITSFPYYPEWKVQEMYAKRSFWFKKEIKEFNDPAAIPVKIYRCPQYTPKNPSGMKRMLLDFTFSFSSLFVLFRLLFTKKFDCVICVVPSFQVGLLAIIYKKLTGAKFLYHIQDLQIDAARDMGMIKSTRLINTLLSIEKYILKQADVVSSISEGMIKKVVAKCDKQVVFFPNWVDTNLYYPIEENDGLKPAFDFEKTDKVVLYSGAIGQKQGLDIILYTAKLLQHLTDVKFVICGSGPYKKTLQDKAKALGLKNLVFMPLQPSEKFNQFLNMADVHLIIQKENASDLVMPSKLSTILSIGGLAVVTAPEDSSLYKVLSNYDMGIITEPEQLELLAEAIKKALYGNNRKTRRNARTYAGNFLLKDKILSNYLGHINNAVSSSIPAFPVNMEGA